VLAAALQGFSPVGCGDPGLLPPEPLQGLGPTAGGLQGGARQDHIMSALRPIGYNLPDNILLYITVGLVALSRPASFSTRQQGSLQHGAGVAECHACTNSVARRHCCLLAGQVVWCCG
jgi:hypothetical protein